MAVLLLCGGNYQQEYSYCSIFGSGAGAIYFASVGVNTNELPVYTNFNFKFTKTGGTIYGYTEGDPFSNDVKYDGSRAYIGTALINNYATHKREKTIGRMRFSTLKPKPVSGSLKSSTVPRTAGALPWLARYTGNCGKITSRWP
jgi:hypothetical protein